MTIDNLEEKWSLCSIVEQKVWTDNLRSIRLDTGPRHHLHGQFARIGVVVEGNLVTRPYSLVNSSDDPLTEIVYNRVPDGALTPILWNLGAGDKIYISKQNYGNFVLEEIPSFGQDLWCCATGTGVGPYVPMVQDERTWQRFDRIVLAHGVRQAEDLAYRGLFERIREERGNRLSYLPVVSREEDFSGLRGRITGLTTDSSLEKASGVDISSKNSQFMLCGNADFINEMRDILLTRGLKKNLRRDPGNITSERYWG